MRTLSSTALTEPAAPSNRRQPVRQTRTNPSRNATNASQPQGAFSAPPGTNPVGFFPAITHFTDSIDALPKEMIRHSTMLKEVDAKIHGPEDVLRKLVAEGLKGPVSKSIQGERREHFLALRKVMADILPTLDEKNHVLATATDALERQLARCQSSYKDISNEISEEARFGNLNHWAYMDKSAEKKGTTAGERTRRDVAVANALAASAHANAEGEIAAIRSEQRREALASRRRVQAIDSDFEAVVKKPAGTAKARKMAETVAVPYGPNPSLVNGNHIVGANPPNKRRKIEKPAPAVSTPMERSLSGVFGQNAPVVRGRAGSPRDGTALESSKRKGRGGGALGTGTGRRRAGTATSIANSPLMASSPVIGTFGVGIKEMNSPVTTTMQRPQSSRARQNSTQSLAQEIPRTVPTPSVASKPANGNPVLIAKANVIEDVALPDKDIATNEKKEVEESVDVEMETRTTSRSNEPPTIRREESVTGTTQTRPPSISTSNRGNGNGKASKTNTPVSASFPEYTRPRSGRNGGSISAFDAPIKRSHKKGAGIAAQLAAQAAAAAAAKDEDTVSLPGDDEDEHEEEARYCYCNGFSYGEMVACDFDGCAREWFHLECAGLARAPTGKGKWYCDDCKKKTRST